MMRYIDSIVENTFMHDSKVIYLYKTTYTKQLMQINTFLCIIYKFVKIFYEKTVYEDTIFVSESL